MHGAEGKGSMDRKKQRVYICRVKDKRVHMQRVKERDREQKDGVWKVKKESKGRKKQRFIERKRKKKLIERYWHHPRKGAA